MDRFRGRNALVTGASRGIGAAIAERLSAEGANLVVVARTVDKHDHLAGSLAETVSRCGTYGNSAHLLDADLSDETSRDQIVPRALALLDGQIDILINNAAAAIYQDILTVPLRRRRIVFEVNLHAPVDLMQSVLPGMVERQQGWILNVSSAGAKYASGEIGPDEPQGHGAPPPSYMGVYGASKAALNRVTIAFAQALQGTGVRINAVAPRSAVLSEGALALIGDSLAGDRVESMEAMVEGALLLCAPDWASSGGIHYTLDLLEERRITVMTLDGRTVYPGGFRIMQAP
jgi:NAD(P)-dependent dehydrogenase (short-subunit alcohol dehydrogenase family)